jgi:hypothetical protein
MAIFGDTVFIIGFLMINTMKVNGKNIKTVREYFVRLVVYNIKVISRMGNLKVMELLYIQINLFMREIGKMIAKMDLANLHIQMEAIMKEIFNKDYLKELVLSNIQMEEFLQDNLEMGNKKGMVNL